MTTLHQLFNVDHYVIQFGFGHDQHEQDIAAAFQHASLQTRTAGTTRFQNGIAGGVMRLGNINQPLFERGVGDNIDELHRMKLGHALAFI